MLNKSKYIDSTPKIDIRIKGCTKKNPNRLTFSFIKPIVFVILNENRHGCSSLYTKTILKLVLIYIIPFPDKNQE